INALLLYAVRRFSRPSLGSYKYLLATFASYDIFLTVLHVVTRPTVVIVDEAFGAVTDPFFVAADRRITNVYASCVTVPYVLVNIHFLYRFWSIRYSHLIALFSNKKFIAFVASWPLICFAFW
ncbi:hypothetical protein PENTCL1PPCAC_14138, partial [Pristionchus entomophagus]